jgi:hypothetical protein
MVGSSLPVFPLSDVYYITMLAKGHGNFRFASKNRKAQGVKLDLGFSPHCLERGNHAVTALYHLRLPLSTLLLIAGGVLIAAGGGYWMLQKKNETTEEM